MATKLYSAITNFATPIDLTASTFSFDLSAQSASLITSIVAGAGATDVIITIGGQAVNFTGIKGGVNGISTSLFSFADGSNLVVGDGLAATTVSGVSTTTDAVSANVLLSTDNNDYLFGVGSNNTASYVNASAGVTASLGLTTSNLSVAATTDTIAAGSDTLLNIKNIIGSKFNDTLTGDSNANILTGNGGVDTLIGGAGNDTFVVSTSNTTVTETSTAAGNGTVKSSVDFILTDISHVSNLILTGAAAIYGTGSTGANTITGNSASNVLNDGDTAGSTNVNNMLDSFGGNDTYIVNSANDTITDVGGIDQVNSYVASYSLVAASGVENLVLVGSTAQTGIGNDLSNKIVGNGGGDTLNGGAGNDTLTEAGKTGNNTLISGGGTTTGTDVLIGGLGNDTLIAGVGATAAIAKFVGDTNAVTMTGGLGNDTYYVNYSKVAINEAVNALYTSDTVISTVSYALNDASSAGVDNMIIHNTNTTGISVTGNAQNNTISVDLTTGFTANNTLIGGNGADTLTGGAGNDKLYDSTSATVADVIASGHNTMTGGAGNDTFYVTNSNDIIVGNATSLVSSIVSYDLSANASGGITQLTLTGTAAVNATANNSGDILIGNSGNNTLTGGSGDDTLTDILGGNNILIGGLGANTLKAGVGNDTLYDSSDKNTSNSSISSLTGGAGNDTYYVTNTSDTITELSAGGTDVVSTIVNYTLSAQIENLILAGSSAVIGQGNTLNNAITVANTSNDTLIGDAGVDTLKGGTGNDTLISGLVSDTAADTSADLLAGGFGNDTYVINSTSDVITEATSAGTDLVFVNVSANGTPAVVGTYLLAANVENMVLGTTGGTAVLNNSGVGSGIDATTAAGNVSDVASTNAINATGNVLDNYIAGNAGANIIYGGSGADHLYGGAGNDTLYDGISATVADIFPANTSAAFFNTMDGGNNSDTYYVTVTGDVITDTGTTGTDVVNSMVTYVLAAGDGVETLNLTGTSAINATGNDAGNTLQGNGAANTITGGAGNDTINGGAGKDTLISGGGTDTFAFSLASDSSAVSFDQIQGFTAGDKINISGLGGATVMSWGGAASGAIPTTLGAFTVQYYTLGPDTFIIANDTSTTGGIDFKVDLVGFTGVLAATDFVL